MASNSTKYPAVKLPHPLLTTYRVRAVSETSPAKLVLALEDQPPAGRPLDQPLHLDSLSWLELTFPSKDKSPPPSNNSAWARARRSPQTKFQWTGSSAPSLGQIWNVVHAIYLAHSTCEYFRVTLHGAQKDIVRSELLSTGLAVEHPKPWRPADDRTALFTDELLILRSSFWQGAASPTGPRPIWVVGDGTDIPLRQPLSQYPLMPENYQVTMKFPDEPVYARHPVRRPKPHPGSICYSRYIPEVDEHFSLEVVDWQNAEHLQLFNTWQNDPRVAKGWNETGTLDQHREYLRRLHEDPHVLCLFGRFNNARFSYYELYWAKVSPPPPLRSNTSAALFRIRFANRTRHCRRTITASTPTRETGIAAATRWLVTRRSAGRAASTPGTRAASTTASSTTRAPRTSLASRVLRARRFCRTRIRRGWLLGSTWTSGISARCILFVVGRSGSSCVRCSGMAGRSRWRVRIARLGMRSCEVAVVFWAPLLFCLGASSAERGCTFCP